MWLNENEAVLMAKEPQISTGLEWANDALPACAVGMDLLSLFEVARPNDYAFLQAQDFVDLSTSAFVGIPEWDAFTEHCETCKDCKK
jgi:hypothetical protein